MGDRPLPECQRLGFREVRIYIGYHVYDWCRFAIVIIILDVYMHISNMICV